MAEAWKPHTGAAEEGAVLAAIEDVPDGLCLEVGGFSVVLVRRGDDIRAFVNAVPHQCLPLDCRGNRLLSADRSVLRCTNHAAGNSVDTGEGVGLGECLDRIAVDVAAGAVRIRRGG